MIDKGRERVANLKIDRQRDETKLGIDKQKKNLKNESLVEGVGIKNESIDRKWEKYGKINKQIERGRNMEK